MSQSQSKSKLIVKNTVFMYSRMLATLFVSLFTARIVYNALGVDGYGTYNLVAGVIIFFTFINNALSASTKRFITAKIDSGSIAQINHIFNTCIKAHVIIAIVVILLAETIGLWFLNNKLNIPPNLLYAANWAYQFSIATAIVSIIKSPYSSVVVAYEKMDIYALFTILEIVLKLILVYVIIAMSGDKLIIYSALLFAISIIDIAIYVVYTHIKMPVCRLKLVNDKQLLREILSFTSWSLVGQAAVVATNQGVGVLVNLFYSVAVNAAMGVSSTISTTVNRFVTNFQVAFNPQIIKSYNSGDTKYLQSLMIRTSKMSSFLIIIFLVPLTFETSNVLKLWLGNYPQYAVEFSILTLYCIYIEAIAAPLWMLIYSQTNIKKYQIVVAIIYSLNFFGGWLVLYLGAPPYSVVVVRLIVFTILLLVRLYYAKKLFTKLNVSAWIYSVIVKGAAIISISLLACAFANQVLTTKSTLAHIIIITAISLCCTLPLIYTLGMSSDERKFIKDILLKKFKKAN